MQRVVMYVISAVGFGLAMQYLHGHVDTTQVMLAGLTNAYLCDKA